ncbi:MAG: translocation/assembly module TamB domain-containing protein [Acidobacteria bacterium]|nr:translocation/assembly module TamB domain-containing protein [Acidobacteriota bacterium]
MSPSSRRFRRAALILAGCLLLVLAAMAGVVAVAIDEDRLLAFATSRLSAALDRPVAAGGLRISLPEGEFAVRGLQVGREPLDAGPAPPVLSIGEVRGNLGLLSLALARLRFESLAIEGLSFWGLDDGSPRRAAPAPSGPGFEALAARLSFSSDRISVAGTTIGYRSLPAPWEVRVDDVAVAFRVAETGSVDGEIRSGLGVVRLGEQPEFPLALDAEFRLRENRFHLDRLGLRSDLLTVDLNGSLDLGEGLAGEIGVAAGGDAGGLARSLFGVEAIDTRGEPWMRFDGTAGFGEDGFALDGEFALPGSRLYGVPLRDWKARVHWDPGRLEVSDSEGFVSGGAATLRVLQVQPSGENPAEVALTVRDASLSGVLGGIFGTPTALRSRVSLDADLRVPLGDPLLMAGTIEASGARPEAGPGALPLGFEMAVAVDEEAVVVQRLTAEGAAFQGTLEGRYPRAGNADFVVSGVAGDAAEVDSVQQEVWRVAFGEDPETTAWDVSGAARFEGTLEGPWPGLVIAGTVEGQGLRFSTFHTDTLVAAAEIRPAAIRLESLSARAGEGTISASGVFDRGDAAFPDLEFDAEWDRWDIREIVDFLEWDLEAEGAVSGRSNTVRRDERYYGGGMVIGSAGTFLEQPFDELSIGWNLDGGLVRLAPLTAAFRGGSAEGELTIDLVDWTMEGAVTGRDYPLAPGLELDWIALRSDFRAEIGGDLEVPELRLEGRIPTVAVLDAGLGPGSVEASVVGERFEASGALDNGAASFGISGTLEADAAGTAVLRELDVAPLLVDAPAERGISITVSGTADFRIEDPLDEWMTAEATLESLRIETPEFTAESGGPARIVMEDGVVEVEEFRVLHSGGELAAGGSVDLGEERLDLTLSGESSLRAAEPFVADLDADGALALEIAVVGSTAAPEVFGEGTIRDGSFRLAGFPHGLSEVNGSVSFDQQSLRIDELKGRLASGDVVASGEVLIDGVELGASDLRVRVVDARFRYPADFSATVNADLRLVGDQGGRLLSGEVRLDDALWSREYELSADLLSDSGSIAVSGDPEAAGFLGDVAMDVRVETDSPFAVRNSIVSLAANAALGLQGTAASPAVVGRADLVEGELFVGAHRFAIVSGRAEFIDPRSIEPVFEVTAETNVRNYRVRLAASGTLEEIEASVSSEPPLRESDILQLLSGVPEANLLGARRTDDPAVAVSATNLLSQQFTGMLGRRAGRVFGIDRVTVDPYMIGRFSKPTARVTLSKQVTPELNVRYSSSLSDADEAIVIVEYARRRVTWILTRDEDGTLGVDFRFRRTY